MQRKIAIVGLSPSWREAPWDDPDWEVWGLRWGDYGGNKPDLNFEMHGPSVITKEAYIQALNDPRCITQDSYPLRAIIGRYRDFFMSSIDYMLALALHNRATVVGLYGVDNNFEYFNQRLSNNYWLGMLEGGGTRLILPDSCDTLKIVPDLRWPITYKERYGYE